MVHSISASGTNRVMITVTSYLPIGRSLSASRSMCTTNSSPTSPTGCPSADWSMPVLSMATWPRGSRSTANTSAGVAAMSRRTSKRSVVMRPQCQVLVQDHRAAEASGLVGVEAEGEGLGDGDALGDHQGRHRVEVRVVHDR